METNIYNYSIRTATEADVPLILSFIRELADYERLSGEVSADEALLREHLFGERPVAGVLLAFHAGEPAGFALWFNNFSTFVGKPGMYLEDIYVKPGLRGLGIGKALFLKLAEIALETGCGRMEWAVLDWNEPAIGFYKKLGARAMDEWTVFRLDREALEALRKTNLG